MTTPLRGMQYAIRKSAGRPRLALSVIIMGFTTLLGAWAFLFPFFVPPTPGSETNSHAADAPLIFLLVIGLCLIAIVTDLETRAIDSKTVALLGVLVATNSLLRPLQGPGGFSGFQVLPILCGYVFGGVFGFLLGSLSVLVSALITGGVGPWMPFQMLAIGWIGMSSGALPGEGIRKLWGRKAEKWVLAAWGAFLGLVFGAIMNLTFWPFLIAGTSALPDDQVWMPGAGLSDAVARYAAFYVATSLPWDIWLSTGNVLLILFLGPSILRLLRRFKQRFFFTLK
jgi:energy-coupling factor transport system substrate-specific component